MGVAVRGQTLLLLLLPDDVADHLLVFQQLTGRSPVVLLLVDGATVPHRKLVPHQFVAGGSALVGRVPAAELEVGSGSGLLHRELGVCAGRVGRGRRDVVPLWRPSGGHGGQSGCSCCGCCCGGGGGCGGGGWVPSRRRGQDVVEVTDQNLGRRVAVFLLL